MKRSKIKETLLGGGTESYEKRCNRKRHTIKSRAQLQTMANPCQQENKSRF